MTPNAVESLHPAGRSSWFIEIRSIYSFRLSRGTFYLPI